MLPLGGVTAPAKHNDVEADGSLIGQNQDKVAALVFWKAVMIKSKIMGTATKHARVAKSAKYCILDTAKIVIDGVAASVVVRLDVELGPVKAAG